MNLVSTWKPDAWVSIFLPLFEGFPLASWTQWPRFLTCETHYIPSHETVGTVMGTQTTGHSTGCMPLLCPASFGLCVKPFLRRGSPIFFLSVQRAVNSLLH